MKLSFVPLLGVPGGEMVPSRAVADDGLNGQKQKTEERERRRKRMHAPCAEIISGDRRQEEQRQPAEDRKGRQQREIAEEMRNGGSHE